MQNFSTNFRNGDIVRGCKSCVDDFEEYKKKERENEIKDTQTDEEDEEDEGEKELKDKTTKKLKTVKKKTSEKIFKKFSKTIQNSDSSQKKNVTNLMDIIKKKGIRFKISFLNKKSKQFESADLKYTLNSLIIQESEEKMLNEWYSKKKNEKTPITEELSLDKAVSIIIKFLDLFEEFENIIPKKKDVNFAEETVKFIFKDKERLSYRPSKKINKGIYNESNDESSEIRKMKSYLCSKIFLKESLEEDIKNYITTKEFEDIIFKSKMKKHVIEYLKTVIFHDRIDEAYYISKDISFVFNQIFKKHKKFILWIGSVSKSKNMTENVKNQYDDYKIFYIDQIIKKISIWDKSQNSNKRIYSKNVSIINKIEFNIDNISLERASLKIGGNEIKNFFNLYIRSIKNIDSITIGVLKRNFLIYLKENGLEIEKTNLDELLINLVTN